MSVDILDFACIAGVELEVYYGAGNAGPFIANLRSPYGSVFFKENKSDCMARSATGWGKMLASSVKALCENINKSGYSLMVIESSGGRREIGVPQLSFSDFSRDK